MAEKNLHGDPAPTRVDPPTPPRTPRAPRAPRASDDQEWVICSAIYVDTGKDTPERRTRSYPKTGLVFGGWRHADCFVALTAWAERLTDAERLAIDPWHLRGNVQGFLTSRGRFVRREEAYSLAQAAGQIPDQQPIGRLFSEDLY